MDQSSEKSELLRRLHDGYQQFHRYIQGLTPEQMQVPGANGRWSVKDVISHFIAHEQFALSEIRYAQSGRRYTPDETDIDIINEQAVSGRRHQTLMQVLQAWDVSFREVVAAVEQLPDSAFDPAGQFVDTLGDTVDGALGNNTYGHYAEHLSTIQKRININN